MATVLDQWHTAPGDQLPQFMETAVRESDFVLIICTPALKARADGRVGGAGYEGDIITGEIFTGTDIRKFIPILRSGSWLSAAPTFCQGKYYIDLSEDPNDESQYQQLLTTLRGEREEAPPVGAGRRQTRRSDAWVPLEVDSFILPSYSDVALSQAFTAISDSVVEQFKDHGVAFTLLAGKHEIPGPETAVPSLQIVCHHRKLLLSAARRHNDLARKATEVALSRDQAGLEQLRSDAANDAARRGHLNIHFSIAVPNHLFTPIRVEYDAALQRIAFSTIDETPHDPRLLRDRLATTSDALQFTSYLMQPHLYLSELNAFDATGPAARLIAYRLDHDVFDFHRFRVLKDDPEVWDFIYPEFDIEVEDRKVR